MSKVWREKADPSKHIDFMSTRNEGGVSVEKSRNNLIDKWVYFAEANGFVFQFANLKQVEECKEYFQKNTHPSTKEDGHDLEHYWHPWYSRLPKGMTKASKKIKVLKALNQILEKWKNS